MQRELFGPYDALLADLFPRSEHYQVSPQFKGIPGTMPFDLTVLYISMKRRVPALFIDIRTFLALNHGPSRATADSLMRERFLDFSSGSLPQTKFIGISAMGTRFAVYEYTPQDRNLVPSCTMPHPDIVTDTAPKERWSYDIMEAAGEAIFRAIVAEIKTMLLAINRK